MNPTSTTATPPAAPFWSVMIPVYRPPENYLRQALESVLQQDPGESQMQIEVVDDCSPDGNSEAMVRAIAGDRVRLSKTPQNLGLAGCWNTCIERARGQWVHILHQDDYLLPGFYTAVERAAGQHPDVSLIATRSLYIDENNVITGVTERVQDLEQGGHSVDRLFYYMPFMCPGVVVKRAFYQSHGGFRSDLKYTLDCEMWARVISSVGGVVLPDVLTGYRISSANESNRLHRTAESLRDIEQLYSLFAKRYPTFNMSKGKAFLAWLTSTRLEHFRKAGDVEALKANQAFWRRSIPLKLRLRHRLVKTARSILG